jgi:hypothetical protein
MKSWARDMVASWSHAEVQAAAAAVDMSRVDLVCQGIEAMVLSSSTQTSLGS